MGQQESPGVPREAKRDAVLDAEPDFDANQAEKRQFERQACPEEASGSDKGLRHNEHRQ